MMSRFNTSIDLAAPKECMQVTVCCDVTQCHRYVWCEVPWSSVPLSTGNQLPPVMTYLNCRGRAGVGCLSGHSRGIPVGLAHPRGY